ncbi:MAG: hypothetical protein EPO38_09615 [Rhizorhabdus sp.]|nr:MAG: hypothetical protein EPO38_09615 [Rhizorhabdus sp.]
MAIDADIVGRRPGLMLGPPFHCVGEAVLPAAPTWLLIVWVYLFHGRLLRFDDDVNMDIPSRSPIAYEAFQIR